MPEARDGLLAEKDEMMKMNSHLTTNADARAMLKAIRKTPLTLTGEPGDAVKVATAKHGTIFRALWKDSQTVLVSMVPDFFG